MVIRWHDLGLAIWLLLLSGILSTTTMAATAQAYLDRDSIFEGETVILTVEVDDGNPGGTPDFSTLTTDFRILDSRRSSERRIINGRSTASTRWVLQLEPLQTGTLAVPAFEFGQYRTAAMNLTVMQPSPSLAEELAERLFLEVEVEPRNPYVQSQVRYTERLFYAVPLLEGKMTGAGVEDAVVERLGSDVSYVDTRNGRLFRVVERHYAIFPQQSGELVIPGSEFEGRIARDGDNQFGFNQGRRVSLNSDPVTLQVRPRPANFGGYWLPSEELTLEEKWSQEPPQFRVGEPITRTITVSAKGLNAAQIPEIVLPAMDGFNFYANQPSINTRNDGTWVYGERTQDITVQPTQAGIFTLPELQLPWWDTRHDRSEVAVLPARTIEVLPAVNTVNQLPQFPRLTEAEPAVVSEGIALWRWVSGGLLALWLVTLFAWWRNRHSTPAAVAPVINSPPAMTPDLQQVERDIVRACRQHDAIAAARGLLHWGAAYWPTTPPRNLGALAARIQDGETRSAIQALDQILYAPGAENWQGDRLAAALEGGLKKQVQGPATTPTSEELPGLYPARVR